MVYFNYFEQQQARIQFGLPLGQQFPGTQRISITPHGMGKDFYQIEVYSFF